MLSGSLVAPNKLRKPRKDAWDISREFPYGGSRDPYGEAPHILFVCHGYVHRDLVACVFKDRAMYILEGAMITGRRFDHIVLFERPFGALQGLSVDANARWYREQVLTCLSPSGEVTLYSMEQQMDLGIYNGGITGIDLAGPNSDHSVTHRGTKA